MRATSSAKRPFPTPVAARKKTPRGSAFRYALRVGASGEIQIFASLPGRRSGRGCAPQTKRNKKKRRCTRLALKGTLTRQGQAGRNTVPFSGRTSNQALKRGSYQATIVATNAGVASTTQKVNFTIVKG